MVAILVGLLGSVVGVFTLTNLFNWFIPDHFNVSPISYSLAFGLSLIYVYFTKELNLSASMNIKAEKDYTPHGYSGTIIVVNLFLLSLGYVTKTFFM